MSDLCFKIDLYWVVVFKQSALSLFSCPDKIVDLIFFSRRRLIIIFVFLSCDYKEIEEERKAMKEEK